MKQIYLLLFFISVVLKSYTQPSINILPKNGDIITNEYAHTAGVIQGAQGANMVWDYSALADSVPAGTFRFVNCAGTPYVGDFPGSGIASVLNDTLYSYFQSKTNSLPALGGESATEEFRYYHPFGLIQVPFTYQDKFIDSVTMFIIKPFSGFTKLKDTIWVTGYGTLKLPGKTFNNVLQCKEISWSQANIDFGGTSIPLSPATDTTFAYYANGIPGALLFYSIYHNGISIISYLENFSSLPLHFISFKAEPEFSGVKLMWQTGDESNTNMFRIERSLDGSTFSTVGDLPAAGNGSHEYSFTDSDLPNVSELFYRIRETDLNGSSIYSTIISFRPQSAVQLSLFPDPASDRITITGTGKYSRLKIFNLSGQQLEDFRITENRITVSVASLLPGAYIAELSDGTSVRKIRFLKD